eukprot:GAHX01000719.1.p1 GENE.GAHX01000719.1~~GAHX01000719.1.p1  ORF type:complete len:63 (-),score=13.35 GAHX01000719.1:149-337(-)
MKYTEVIKVVSKTKLKDILKVDSTDSLALTGVMDETHCSLVDEKTCIEIVSEDGNNLIKFIS